MDSILETLTRMGADALSSPWLKCGLSGLVLIAIPKYMIAGDPKARTASYVFSFIIIYGIWT